MTYPQPQPRPQFLPAAAPRVAQDVDTVTVTVAFDDKANCYVAEPDARVRKADPFTQQEELWASSTEGASPVMAAANMRRYLREAGVTAQIVTRLPRLF